MTVDEALISRIVEGVLAELSTSAMGMRASSNGSHVSQTSTSPADAHSSSPAFKGGAGGNEQRSTSDASPAANEFLHLNDAVITADVLEASLNGRRRIVIGKKAVLTPSARDYLKKQNIDWTRGAGADGNPAPSVAAWKAFVAYSTPALESAAAEVGRQAGGFGRELSGSTTEAAAAAVSAVCKAEVAGAVVVTREPGAAACRANRNSRVRAAVVRDVADVERVRRELGANVVCLDPAERSHFELRNLLRAIVTGPAPKPPEGWSD